MPVQYNPIREAHLQAGTQSIYQTLSINANSLQITYQVTCPQHIDPYGV